jgi:hypothetical protein
MYNIVFLKMNIRCSKHVEDKKNRIKTLILKSVHFVGQHYITLEYLSYLLLIMFSVCTKSALIFRICRYVFGLRLHEAARMNALVSYTLECEDNLSSSLTNHVVKYINEYLIHRQWIYAVSNAVLRLDQQILCGVLNSTGIGVSIRKSYDQKQKFI